MQTDKCRDQNFINDKGKKDSIAYILISSSAILLYLTLFRLMLFHVVGDRDHPFGTGYFVLLLTLMCQLECATHVSAPRNVPVGPQAVGLPPLLPVCQAAQDGHKQHSGWGTLSTAWSPTTLGISV